MNWTPPKNLSPAEANALQKAISELPERDGGVWVLRTDANHAVILAAASTPPRKRNPWAILPVAYLAAACAGLLVGLYSWAINHTDGWTPGSYAFAGATIAAIAIEIKNLTRR